MVKTPRTPAEKRRYRKVICRMYGDDKFLQLSRPQPNAQSLWIYLITGPHTNAVPGLFQAGEAQLAEALQWPIKGFRAAWQEIARVGMARAEWQARVVWLPNAIRHNAPDNPNVVKGWRDALDEIPACALKAEALAHLALFLKGLGEPFLKPFLKLFGEPLLEATGVGLANQEQEQEQEQEDPPNPQKGAIVRQAETAIADATAAILTSDEVGDRAREFLEKYPEIYATSRHGASYPVKEARDFPTAIELVTRWPDPAYLTQMLRLFLLRKDFAPKNEPGSPRQFAFMAPQCDAMLRASVRRSA